MMKNKMSGIIMVIMLGLLAQTTTAKEALNAEQIQLQKDTARFQRYIPKHYSLFSTVHGDLNKDGLEDTVLIVKAADPKKVVRNRFDEVVDRNRRGIIVLLGQKNKTAYQTLVKNLDCFSSDQEDGGVYFAPELSSEIKNGILELHYGHGRYGYWGYKFRIEHNDMRLIGYDHSSNYGPMVESFTSLNFITGKKLYKDNINKMNPEQPERFKETWSNIQIAPMYLSKIKDFDEISFE